MAHEQLRMVAARVFVVHDLASLSSALNLVDTRADRREPSLPQPI
jgi:hypothetical protein